MGEAGSLFTFVKTKAHWWPQRWKAPGLLAQQPPCFVWTKGHMPKAGEHSMAVKLSAPVHRAAIESPPCQLLTDTQRLGFKAVEWLWGWKLTPQQQVTTWAQPTAFEVNSLIFYFMLYSKKHSPGPCPPWGAVHSRPATLGLHKYSINTCWTEWKQYHMWEGWLGHKVRESFPNGSGWKTDI